MLKIKVKISTKEKQVTRVFESASSIQLSDDDPFIKKCVSEVLKDFDSSPEKINVTATLVL